MGQVIPLDATEVEPFTPDSLKEADNAPVFKLNAAIRRDRRRLRRLAILEGGITHTEEELREELLRACEKMWDADTAAKEVPRLKEYFEAVDQHRIAHKEWSKEAEAIEKANADLPKPKQKTVPDAPAFHHPDSEEVEALEASVRREWRPLREMIADNDAGTQVYPLCVCAVVLGGWSGLKTPFRRTADGVPMETMEELADELHERDPLAFGQVFLACSRRLFPDADTEKN